MRLEEALEVLKVAAKDLSSIGDVKEYNKFHRQEFFQKIHKVIQYWNYIYKNADPTNDIWMEALTVVDDISYENPSLKEIVEDILLKGGSKSKTEEKTEEFDKNNFVRIVMGYIDEIRAEFQNSYDTEKLGDIEWQLEQYKVELEKNSSLFSQEEYTNIMNSIYNELNKINSVNSLMENTIMKM